MDGPIGSIAKIKQSLIVVHGPNKVNINFLIQRTMPLHHADRVIRGQKSYGFGELSHSGPPTERANGFDAAGTGLLFLKHSAGVVGIQ